MIEYLKLAITKADPYDPVFPRVFEEYARYRGLVIILADGTGYVVGSQDLGCEIKERPLIIVN